MWRSGTCSALGDFAPAAAGKGQSHSNSLAAPEWTEQVLASRLTSAMICIPPSTSQRLHLARRHVSFRGIDQSLGNYLAAAVLFVRVLVLCVFAEKQGCLEGVEFRSRPQFFNTKLQPRHATASAEKCNATIGTKNIRLVNRNLSPKPD